MDILTIMAIIIVSVLLFISKELYEINAQLNIGEIIHLNNHLNDISSKLGDIKLKLSNIHSQLEIGKIIHLSTN